MNYDPNVAAWLRVIRAGESNQNDDAYTIINGGAHFAAPPWVHPYAGMSAPPGKASGAYGYIPHTWQRLGLPDFSPANQDLGAVMLTKGRGAYDDVVAGDLAAAMRKCFGEWVSLQTMPLEKAQVIFAQYGGRLLYGKPPMKDQPTLIVTPRPESIAVGGADNSNSVTTNPASGGFMPDAQPQQQPSLLDIIGPIATMVNPIAGSLLTAFMPQIQQKLGAAINRHTDDPAMQQQVAGNLGDLLIGLAQKLSGKQDPVDAVSTVKNDAALLAQAQTSFDSSLSAIATAIGPMMDKLQTADESKWQAERAGRDDAGNLAIAEHKAGVYDMTRALVWFAGFTVAGLVLMLDGGIVWQVVVQGKDANVGLIGMAGTLSMAVVGAWGVLYAYRFDGSKASSATQAAMAALAQRNQGAST